MFPSLEYIKTLVNGLKVYIEDKIKAIQKEVQSLPQSDWAENNPISASYVKNRPGGYAIVREISEVVTLVRTDSYNPQGATVNIMELNNPPIQISEGDKVLCDIENTGTMKEYTVSLYDDCCYFSNDSFTNISSGAMAGLWMYQYVPKESIAYFKWTGPNSEFSGRKVTLVLSVDEIVTIPHKYLDLPVNPITKIESLDATNMIVLRNLDSGSYVLNGYFKPYTRATSTMTFSSSLLVNILKGSTESYVQVFYPYNNTVQYLKITNTTYERKDIYLNNLLSTGDDVVIKSSTSGSTKKFKITVDDSGTISATEVT